MKYKHIHYTEEFAEEVTMDGAQGVAMRTVIGPRDGADKFHMRILTFRAGGCSPSHSHPWEHENFVVSGEGEVEIDGEIVPMKTGDVVLVPPDAHHQYRSAKGMEMMCLIPQVDA